MSHRSEADCAAEETSQADVLGWGTALHFIKAAIDTREGMPPELWLVTRRAQAVREREELTGLAQAPLVGFGKVIGLEFPETRCIGVDVDDGDEEQAGKQLFEEIRRGSEEDQVAFRGSVRYVARLTRDPVTAEQSGFAPRSDGTYLITGGQRGLGLETTKWLVENGARSLVLLARGDADLESLRDLADLRRAGAAVETFRADVSDREQLARALAHIESHLPQLRGWFARPVCSMTAPWRN